MNTIEKENELIKKVFKFLSDKTDDKLTKDELKESLSLLSNILGKVEADKSELFRYAKVLMGLSKKINEDGRRDDIEESHSIVTEKIKSSIDKISSQVSEYSEEDKPKAEGLIKFIKTNVLGFIKENYSSIGLSEDYIDLNIDTKIAAKFDYLISEDSTTKLINMMNKFQENLENYDDKVVNDMEIRLMEEFLTEGDYELLTEDDDKENKDPAKEKSLMKRVGDVLTMARKALSMKDDDIEETMKFRYKAFRALFAILTIVGVAKYVPQNTAKQVALKLLLVGGTAVYAGKYNRRSVDLVKNKIEYLDEKIDEADTPEEKLHLRKLKSNLERNKDQLENELSNTDKIKSLTKKGRKDSDY